MEPDNYRTVIMPATETRLLTSAEVCDRTGITYRRLLYWRDKGLIEPARQVYGVDRGRHDSNGTGPGTTILWAEDVVDRIRDMLERIDDCPLGHPGFHR